MIRHAAALCLLCVTSGQAQRVADARVGARPSMMRTEAATGSTASTARAPARVPTGVLVAGAFTGAAAAYGLGWHLGNGCEGGECWGHAYGVVLEPLFLPLGVHLANRTRGSLGITVLYSFLGAAGAGLFGLALASMFGDDSWPIGVAAIIGAQTAMAVSAERLIEERRLQTTRP
jgi:hypothetical protein